MSYAYCHNCNKGTRSEYAALHYQEDLIYGDLKRLPESGSLHSERKESTIAAEIHPWRRLFARSYDATIGYLLRIFVFSFSVGMLFPDYFNWYINILNNPLLLFTLVYILWLPFEATFISFFGTTPVKSVFGIHILKDPGRKLSLPESIKRTILVWMKGEGFGIPLVTIITRFVAYKTLKREGITTWDAVVGSEVHHKKWGFWRMFAVTVFIIFMILLLGMLNLLGTSNQM